MKFKFLCGTGGTVKDLTSTPGAHEPCCRGREWIWCGDSVRGASFLLFLCCLMEEINKLTSLPVLSSLALATEVGPVSVPSVPQHLHPSSHGISLCCGTIFT